MIDLNIAEKEFKKYLKNYDSNNGSIKLKIVHTYKTVECAEYIAKNLELSEEDVKLAKLIGLLHDIGRFEQRKTTNKFDDSKKFDHAQYVVKILFQDNMIRKFIKEDSYDNVIYKAIINHSKYKIDEGLNEKELLHAKIIRDADKLDNFRVKEIEYFGNMFEYNPETIENEQITPIIFEDFMDHKQILKENRVTQIDNIVSYIAFIFDLNFDITKQYIKNKDYIRKIIGRVNYQNEDTKIKMKQIEKCADEYLNR